MAMARQEKGRRIGGTMSELGDDFRAWREHKKAVKENSKELNMFLLESSGEKFQILSPNGPHIRIQGFDFWASTGKWRHKNGKEHGYGLMRLFHRLGIKPK